MECFECHSTDVIRNGFYKDFQKYKCKDCGRQFSGRSFSFFCRHRFPEHVIRNTILYTHFVSTRYSVFLAKETMWVVFSRQTAYNWAKKFACLVSKLVKLLDFSNIWHVDEKFVKARNKKDNKGNVKFSYLWVVSDDKNNIIAVHVSHSRDIVSAKKILGKALKRAKKPPDIIVSDGLPAYKKACKHVFGRKTKHAVRHFETKAVVHKGKIYYLSNNRIESLNSKINLWYKKFRGFKSIETANLWCESFAYFYNFMRPRTTEHKIESIQLTIKH